MRPIYWGLPPKIHNVWGLSAKELFDRSGGNTGNLAFQYALRSHLGQDAFVAGWEMPPEQLKEHGDIIVTPLANQLGRHTDLGDVAQLLERAKLPVLGIGLGAQSTSDKAPVELTQGTERWVRVLADLAPSSSPNIGVRGEFTMSVMERLGLGRAARVMGCPSNFINPDNSYIDKVATRLSAPIRKIGVAAGIPHIPRMTQLEQELADLATLTNGPYIVQHGLSMVQLGRAEFSSITADEFERSRKYIAPHLAPAEFQSWIKQHARAYGDVDNWMDELRSCDFLIGTRFHGAMLAIQAGTPAGCIVFDSRVEEMCETMKLPFIRFSEMPSGITRQSLIHLFSFEEKVYRAARCDLARNYQSILAAAGIKPAPIIVEAAA